MSTITFPHMGHIDIALKSIFTYLGQKTIIPPKPNKNTASLGSKYAPEFACLPLKINLGNFIEALNLGADLIVTGGGEGPCRFGYYGEMQRRILNQMGYNFEITMINQTKGFEIIKKIKHITRVKSYKDVIKAVYFGWNKMKLIEQAEEGLRAYRPFELNYGDTERVFHRILIEIDKIERFSQIKGFPDYIRECFEKIGTKDVPDYLRIGIVGEVYMVIEPFVNFNLEKRLAEMGILVERTVKITNWLKRVWSFDPRVREESKMIRELARPYLAEHIGGEGIYSLGHTVYLKKNKYDGVIQLAPFTCMPEIVAYSLFPNVRKKEGIPVLSLFLDEHSSETGVMTRVEAFVDLIRRQKSINGPPLIPPYQGGD